MKTFGKIVRIAFIMIVIAFIGGLGVMAGNECTLEPVSSSRVYSTHEVTEATGWRLVVDGDEYPNENHLDGGILWDCLNKPERFFRVVTWEGVFGLKRFRVEEVVENQIRMAVKAK